MSAALSPDEKNDALFTRHPVLPLAIFFGAVGIVAVVALLGIGKYRTWRDEHRPTPEIAAAAAEKAGYTVLDARCLIIHDGFGTLFCNDSSFRAALTVADREDNRLHLIVFCDGRKPSGCSIEVKDWKTIPSAEVVD